MARHGRAEPKNGRGYVLIVLACGFFGTVALFAVAREHATPGRMVPYERPTSVAAPDPIEAVTRGLEPTASVAEPGRPSDRIRAIVLSAREIRLLAGGREIRRLPLDGEPAGLRTIVDAVGDPSWIGEPEPGQFELRAALILDPRTELSVAPPITTDLRLVNLPGVFLGANGARLTLDQVRVQAVGSDGRAAADGDGFRPFVTALNGSVLVANRSTFSTLGWNWNGSYGVSWMSGTTGSSTDSTYEGNFVGAHTDHADGVRFTGDVYRMNRVYGLDQHAASNRITVENCTAVRNGVHGIMLSDNVTESSLRGCSVSDNGADGIRLDGGSTGNTVAANVVRDNRGDGIALSDSAANQIRDNRISGNRVGIDRYGSISGATILTGNELDGNARSWQGVEPELSNRASSNGGQWDPRRAAVVAAAVVAIGALWASATWRLRRQQRPSRVVAAHVRRHSTRVTW